jgi:hypothetical protein
MFWSNILGPKNISENISDRKKNLKLFWQIYLGQNEFVEHFSEYLVGKINLATSLTKCFWLNLYDNWLGEKC